MISNSEVIQNDNIEKFLEYFGDKNCCDQFKNDFFDIDDSQKNEALYFDCEEGAHNQFFVMLLIKPQSEDPKTAIDKCWQDQVNQKAVRILAHQKLRKLLRLGIKNYLLNLKSEKSKNYITSFKMEHYNWVSLFDKDDSQVAIKALYKNAETTKYLDILYSVQRQLFNILNNHYSIRNSLDTHFIMGRLNEVNQVLNKTRESLNKP